MDKDKKREANRKHYLKREAIKVIEAWNLDFNLGNAVKYIARAGKKDPQKLLRT